MEHTSILNQKKRIKKISVILSSLMLIFTGIIIFNFCSGLIKGSKVEPVVESYLLEGETKCEKVNDADINTLDVNYANADDQRVVKTIVSILFVMSILAFIIYVIRMVVVTLKGNDINGRIETYLLKIGLCLVIAGISGVAWDAIFDKLGDGTNLVIIVSGIVYMLLSEIFKLASLYKEDSELSV